MGYDKAKHTIIYEKDGQRYKLCKIFFGTDGSYYVTSPYHPAKRALLVKQTVNYNISEMRVPLEQAVDLAAAEDDEKRIKLAHHPDGFVQFSGQGIVSGKDPEGNIRGMGIMSWTLDSPARGPAFALAMDEPEHFERAGRVKDISCVFKDEELTSMPGQHSFVLEGHYLPAEWRRFARAKPDGTKIISIVHPAGTVLELKAIFPSEQCALQNFIGLELYTIPVVEEVTPFFVLSGSAGNLRRNEDDELLGDGIHCMYPNTDRIPVYRILDYRPTAPPSNS